MTLVPVPSLALARVLAGACVRSYGDLTERKAMSMLRAAYVEHFRRHVGCADLRGSVLECRACTCNPCPHGRHGGI